MLDWRYNNPVGVYFGQGIVRKLSKVIGSRKVLLITTPGFTKRGVTSFLKRMLGDTMVGALDMVLPNPTFESIKSALNEIRQYDHECIIALGGGSAIDTAKALAAAETSNDPDWIEDHLKSERKVGNEFEPKPIIAIPTTSGSGSEVTMWGSIWDMEAKRKHSINHPSLYPENALLDPELTLTLPGSQTVYCGLDALSHAMESIWNKHHNPVSDIFAQRAIRLVLDFLPDLYQNLNDITLRTLLLKASLFAGLAFSNTKTALAHSISYPLTAYFNLPHGLAASLPLPHLIRFNRKMPSERMKVMAGAFGGRMDSEEIALEILRLFEVLRISPHLSDYGISELTCAVIFEAAITPDRSNNNIFEIEKSELEDLIRQLL